MDKAQSNGTVSGFSLSDAGKEAFYIQNSLLGEHWSSIVESFNSDYVMVVNGQRINAFCKRLLMWNQSYNDPCIENG